MRIGDLIRRPPITILPDASLRDAANEMIRNEVGRLVVVDQADPRKRSASSPAAIFCVPSAADLTIWFARRDQIFLRRVKK